MVDPRIRRFESIQILRGIASLLVVFVHSINVVDFASPDWHRGWLNSAFALNEFGASGVDLFFVISGFVMAHSMNGFEGSAGAARFLARRFWRVVPPFWLACFLFLPLAGMIGNPPTAASLANAVTFFPLSKGAYVAPPLVVGWTLTFELGFYAIVAAAILLSTGHRRSIAVLAATAALAAGGAYRPGGFLTNPLIAEFSLGVAAYLIWRRGIPKRICAVLFISGAILLLMSATIGWSFDTRLPAAVDGDGAIERVLCWGVPWALVLLGCLDRASGGGRVARYGIAIGDASYSIYLSHMFVIAPAIAVAGASRQFCPPDLLIIVIFIAGAALGLLAYRTLERPYLDWLQHRRTPSAPNAVPSLPAS